MCKNAETEVINLTRGYFPIFEALKETALNLTKALTLQEAMVYAQKITTYYNIIVEIGQLYTKYQDKIACYELSGILISNIQSTQVQPRMEGAEDTS